MKDRNFAYHYWFDQTTLTNNAARKFYNSLAKALNARGIDIHDYQFVIDIMDTDFETCVDRNNRREGYERVPMDVMRNMRETTGVNADVRIGIDEKQLIQIHRIIEDTRKDV